MSTDASAPQTPSGDPAAAAPQPTVHEAALASGPSGAVIRGPEIDFATAVLRRRAGLDIVVCGDDLDANRRVAYAVESSVGPVTRPQKPHANAGPASLPHFHQKSGRPGGHCFYETAHPPKKARRSP
jgi:hypothetical protein